MVLAEKQLSEIINSLEKDFAPYNERMKVRRALIERMPDMLAENAVGTNVPKPYDKSALLIKTVTGDVIDGVQHYANRISANPPQPIVPRVAKRGRVANKIEESAAEQERLFSALWMAADGPRKQYQIAFSQSWCRVGWYLTLPRETGFGLPDRSYFEELTDEQIAQMRSDGHLSPAPVDDGKWVESADNWVQRRRKKAEDDAVSGKGLFTLEAIPGDICRWRMDRNGVKYWYSVEECPKADFMAGSDFMKEVARKKGYKGDECDRFGLVTDDRGKIVAGISDGGERDSSPGGYNFIRFVDRECIYFLVSSTGSPTGATLLYSTYHGAGRVPAVPVPGVWTDSRRPGAEFSSPMESVFAYAPLLNQIETLISNAMVFNAIPRFVNEKADGSLIVDEQGNPREISAAPTLGLDPAQIAVVEGHVKQLKVEDTDFMVQVLNIYMAQMQKAMPPDVTQGEGGTSGAAWAIRQLLSAAQADLAQPVSNHAAAMRDVFSIWVRWMRLLDVPVFCLSIPQSRGSMRSVRGLIEFEPENLVEGFEVVQSKDSASDRIVLQQHGIELRREGVIDDRRFFEEYMHEADPVQAEKDMYAQQLKGQLATTILQQMVTAMQGKVWQEFLKRFPNSAILQAELMAEQVKQQEMAMAVSGAGPLENHALPRGNVAEANGLREAGIGGSSELPGNPESGLAAMTGRMG